MAWPLMRIAVWIPFHAIFVHETILAGGACVASIVRSTLHGPNHLSREGVSDRRHLPENFWASQLVEIVFLWQHESRLQGLDFMFVRSHYGSKSGRSPIASACYGPS